MIKTSFLFGALFFVSPALGQSMSNPSTKTKADLDVSFNQKAAELFLKKTFITTREIYLYLGAEKNIFPYQWMISKANPHGAYLTLPVGTVLETVKIKGVVNASSASPDYPSRLNAYYYFIVHFNEKGMEVRKRAQVELALFSGFFTLDLNFNIVPQEKSDVLIPSISDHLERSDTPTIFNDDRKSEIIKYGRTINLNFSF